MAPIFPGISASVDFVAKVFYPYQGRILPNSIKKKTAARAGKYEGQWREDQELGGSIANRTRFNARLAQKILRIAGWAAYG